MGSYIWDTKKRAEMLEKIFRPRSRVDAEIDAVGGTVFVIYTILPATHPRDCIETVK